MLGHTGGGLQGTIPVMEVNEAYSILKKEVEVFQKII